MSSVWVKDDQCGAHYLQTELGGYYVVMKSAAGDWYAGFNPDDAPCCEGDIEYFDTWQQARAFCESEYKERSKT